MTYHSAVFKYIYVDDIILEFVNQIVIQSKKAAQFYKCNIVPISSRRSYYYRVIISSHRNNNKQDAIKSHSTVY